MAKQVDIFNYFDCREFLKDVYEFYKKRESGFSYRHVARKAGFNSAGYFTKILQGKAGISSSLIIKLARTFRLKKHETKYFTALVHYNQAKSHEEKKHFFDELMALRRIKDKTLGIDEYEYFSKWYFIAIRELLDFCLVKDNYEELAAKLIPQITPAQAKRAINTLGSLGLIRKNPEGYYEKSEAVVTTGPEWNSLAIIAVQQDFIDMAKNAQTTLPREEHDISCLTLSLSRKSERIVREKIRDLRKELLDLAKNDELCDRVTQVNFQVFPLSKPDNGN
jgi:uncharacterized protein (TIGR02147 family)